MAQINEAKAKAHPMMPKPLILPKQCERVIRRNGVTFYYHKTFPQ
jgi:hypothetical protein